MLQKLTSFMRISFALFFFFTSLLCWSQFKYSGQVSELHANQKVYLSLIDDYRKTSRVYLDQIIQTTIADSLGFFTFEGNTLPSKNRMYSIHVDGCEEGLLTKNHFLRECPSTERLLFIGNNRDTITIPLLSGQAFCDIISTNSSSSFLLEMEALKEEMILDFTDNETALARNLKFNKWFDQFHDFAERTREPLVALSVYSFLSNRTNETFDPYLTYLKKNTNLPELAVALNTHYPETTYTSLLREELLAKAEQDKIMDNKDWHWTDFTTMYMIVGLLLVTTLLYMRSKRKIDTSGYHTLSPQERKVCDAILEGKTNNEIALEFFVSLSTVKTHVNSIYKKLGVSSRQELKDKL